MQYSSLVQNLAGEVRIAEGNAKSKKEKYLIKQYEIALFFFQEARDFWMLKIKYEDSPIQYDLKTQSSWESGKSILKECKKYLGKN